MPLPSCMWSVNIPSIPGIKIKCVGFKKEVSSMLSILVGALSWTFVGPEGGDITSVSMEGDKALAASLKVAYYSLDSAQTWSRVDVSVYSPIDAFLTGFETAILSGRFFIFHSDGYIYSDDGIAWTPVDIPGVIYVGEPSGGYLPFIAGNSVYLISASDYTATPVFTPGADTLLIAVGSLDSLWFAFARYNSDSVIVYRGILDTVSLVGTFGYSGGINDVEINPTNPDEILLATFGGIYASTDGGVTFGQDVGSLLSGVVIVNDIEFVGVDTVAAGSFYFSGGYIGTKSLLGWSFDQVYSDAIVVDIARNIFAAFGVGVVYTEDGTTFEERNSGLYAHVLFNPGMVSNDRDDRLSFINTGGRAFYSTDGGNTWNIYGYKMDIGTAIEAAPSDPQKVYIGGLRGSGDIYNPGGILLVKSTDGGATFSVLRDTAASVAFDLFPMEIQTGSNADEVFMVSGSPGSWVMEYSSDGGSTFNTVRTAAGYNGFCFSCMDTLFIVIDTGDVYMSVDAGATWNYITYIGYPGNVYTTYRDGYLYYSTGHDAYLRYIDVATGAIDSIDMSSTFDSLGQIQVSVNGDFFITGFQGGIYKIAYGPTIDNLTVEDAPAFGGIVPLSNYVFFFVPDEGAFYVSSYPTSLSETDRGIRVRYTASGIILEGVDGRISIYDIRGRLVRTSESNFISRTSLPAGVYVVKTSRGSVRIILH